MSARGPANHHVLGESTSTFTHLFLAALIFVLSTPTFNPILVTCDVLGIPPLAFTTLALVFFVHNAVADIESIVYYGARVFLHSVLSIFFRSIEVVGTENIPVKGPVIFTGEPPSACARGGSLAGLSDHLPWPRPCLTLTLTPVLPPPPSVAGRGCSLCHLPGNHSNQFVDGLQVLCHARHRVGFLIAEKSYNMPVIGHFAKLCGCMPVKRPQVLVPARFANGRTRPTSHKSRIS